MADFDWTGLIQGGLQAVTGYVQQNMAMKQAKKLAKIQASGSGMQGFPMLGTGNMRFAPGGAMAGVNYAMPYGSTVGGGGMMGTVTDAIFGPVLGPVVDSGVNYFTGPGGGSRRGVTYECYTTPSGRSAVTGTRSLGRPMLWSGDLSAVRRVARVRRKLGAGRRFR